jgi:16S rRNA (cytosine967-C5)-methyltransferase
LVEPGGRLIYATCSLLPEENEAQVSAFLAAHPDFHLVKPLDVWLEAVGEPSAFPGGEEDLTLTLTPARHGTDGFFMAVMERSKTKEE